MLTPKDIQSKEFEIKLRGYSREEVDAFLDEVIKDFQIMIDQNKQLLDENRALEKAVDRYKDMELSMQKSIDAAKETAAQIKKNAEVEAEFVVKRAKLNARDMEKQIDVLHAKRREEIGQMEEELAKFKARIKMCCTDFLDSLPKVE